MGARARRLGAQSPLAQSPPAQSPPAQSPPAQSPPAQSPPALGSRALLCLLAALLAALAGASLLPRLAAAPEAQRALWGAAALCGLWAAALLALRRPLSADVVIRRPHWVQILMHSTIYTYWGLHYDLVRHTAPLILAQIPLAFALDLLLSWTRGRRWHLGFGPIPIIGSLNLFLWFKDPHYHWQLVMVAIAFVGRDALQWTWHGRRRHIFNPSALALTALSAGLIATDSSSITWGEEIATRLEVAPRMFEVMFGVGLVVQTLFGVTWTTLGAAASLWGFTALWALATGGDHFFTDTAIPIAVFLGMNLLVTDPATSPRSASGKALFGALYGLLVAPQYVLLPALGQPAFFDKLLQVPLCNLLAPALDRVGARLDARLAAAAAAPLSALPRALSRPNALAVLAWGLLFTLLLRGELTAHPGARPEHWRERCAGGARGACLKERHALERGCGLGRPAACHALADRLTDPAALTPDHARARRLWREACAAGHAPSCDATRAVESPAAPAAPPDAPLPAAELKSAQEALEARCGGAGEGEAAACVNLATLHLAATPPALPPAAAAFERACALRAAAGCANLGLMSLRGDGVPRSFVRAVELHRQACDLGAAPACGRLGVLYERGGEGVAPDPVLARGAFERGCAGGDAGACLRGR